MLSQGKDTALVAVLGILLHLLQVVLLPPKAPGVVFELRYGVTVTALQSVAEHLGLSQPLQPHIILQLVNTGPQREREPC